MLHENVFFFYSLPGGKLFLLRSVWLRLFVLGVFFLGDERAKDKIASRSTRQGEAGKSMVV
jgi:hypothetical protein